MATKLQMVAAWLRDAAPGDQYIYHVGTSLAVERQHDNQLDRVAKALALAAGMDPPEDDNHRNKGPVLSEKEKNPPRITLFTQRTFRQTLFIARRLNTPLAKDVFVQTADPRVSAYGWRNRIKEDLA